MLTGHSSNPNETGNLFHYFTQGVCATEVEVDTLTGDHTVLRVDINMDVGKSLNPAIDYGQMYVSVRSNRYSLLKRSIVKGLSPKDKGYALSKKAFGYVRTGLFSRLAQESIPTFLCFSDLRLEQGRTSSLVSVTYHRSSMSACCETLNGPTSVRSRPAKASASLRFSWDVRWRLRFATH